MTTRPAKGQPAKGNLTSPPGRYRRWTRRWTVLIVTLVGLVAAQTNPAVAVVPGNDNFANATTISALPFSDSGDLAEATTEPDEPRSCDDQDETIWYVFTATADAMVRADLFGSHFGVVYNVYQSSGSGFDGLQFLGCSNHGPFFTARADTTYYFQVGSYLENKHFQFQVQELPPPANDNFADATPVTTLPYDDTVDHLIAATSEAGEPFPCAGGAVGGSVWWAFTPTTAGSYLASLGGPLSLSLAVYTGSSLGDLSIVSCSSGDRVVFRATPGTTYYVRALENVRSFDFPMVFRLDTTPEPVANFDFVPSNPSIFDSIQFIDFSSDPAGVGIQSQAWSFGDGATAEGCCPTHRYTRNRDYTATLTVTTNDGRSASISRVVHVSTHDVAIVQINAPRSARVGQTIEINVYVKNYRQLETVQVDLFKSSPQGFEQVGSRTQTVPIKPGNGTTKFRFTNTILETDGSMGKVSFKAVALIIDHHDALPADNEFISPPITVKLH